MAKTIKEEKGRQSLTALISGGAGGIGLAIARKLVSKNINTVIADIASGRNLPSVKGAEFIYCDISNSYHIDSLFDKLNETNNLPEILICNAGVGIHERLTEGDPEKWQTVFNINVMGTLRLIRSFVPHMVKNQAGEVIIISSVSSGKAYEYGGVYSASKTAVEIIAETLRLEVMPHIRVTVIAPGVTNTRFFENMVSGQHPIQDFEFKAIDPEEVAESVWYSISRPGEISINKITLRPTPQAF